MTSLGREMAHFLIFLLYIMAMVFVVDLQAKPCDSYLSTSNHSGSVYKYGDVVHFKCVVLNPNSIDISKLALVNLQTNFSMAFQNSTGNTTDVFIGVDSLNITGQYSCRYGNCNQDTLLSVLHISVDPCSIPENEVYTKPDIECVVEDMTSLSCHWIQTRTVNDCDKWRAMYTSKALGSYFCCVNQMAVNSTDTCPASTLTCNVPTQDVFLNFTYTFVLSRYTQHGEETYSYTLLTGYDMVRVGLDKHVNLEPGPRDIHVTFTLNHSPASVHGVMCNVSYTSQWNHSNTLVVQVDHNSLDVNVTLHQLTPYTVYTINITCKPRTSLYWSNHVTGTGRSLAMAPESSPSVLGYSLETSQNLVQIYLYLKPVPRLEWYGKNLKYVVTTGNGHVVGIFNGSTITVMLPGRIRFSSSVIYTLYSKNEAGESKTTESINVIAKENFETIVVVEEDHTGISVLLFPPRDSGGELVMEKVGAVTFFRCQGLTGQYPPVCKEKLEQQTTYNSSYNFQWSPPLDNSPAYTWYYGVTQHRNREGHDQYITWSTCVFRKNNIGADTQLDVSARYNSVNKTVVIVTLHFDYCALRHRPIWYIVDVWKSGTNATEYCSQQSSDFQRFQPSPTMKFLNVSVGEITSPVLCVRVLYRHGDYDRSGAIIPQPTVQQSGIFISEDTLTATDVTLAVIGSVIASIILTLLILFLRRYRQNLLKNNTIPLRVITSLLENAPTVKDKHQQQPDSDVPSSQSMDGQDKPIHITDIGGVVLTYSNNTEKISTLDSAVYSDSYPREITDIPTHSHTNSDRMEGSHVKYTLISHRKSTQKSVNETGQPSASVIGDGVEHVISYKSTDANNTSHQSVLNYARLQNADTSNSLHTNTVMDSECQTILNYAQLQNEYTSDIEMNLTDSLNRNNDSSNKTILNYAQLQSRESSGNGIEIAGSSSNTSTSHNKGATLNYAQIQNLNGSGDEAYSEHDTNSGSRNEFDSESISITASNSTQCHFSYSTVRGGTTQNSTLEITTASGDTDHNIAAGDVDAVSDDISMVGSDGTDVDSDVMDSYFRVTSSDGISSGYTMATFNE